MYLKRIIQDILPINQLSLSGCIRWLPPELVDNGDLPEISILQTNKLGLLLQLALKSTKRIHPQLSGVLSIKKKSLCLRVR